MNEKYYKNSLLENKNKIRLFFSTVRIRDNKISYKKHYPRKITFFKASCALFLYSSRTRAESSPDFNCSWIIFFSSFNSKIIFSNLWQLVVIKFNFSIASVVSIICLFKISSFFLKSFCWISIVNKWSYGIINNKKLMR